jgi:hypothetical protein
MREKPSGRFIRDPAGAQRFRQRVDACREPVGAPLKAIVRHDNKLLENAGRSFKRATLERL